MSAVKKNESIRNHAAVQAKCAAIQEAPAGNGVKISASLCGQNPLLPYDWGITIHSLSYFMLFQGTIWVPRVPCFDS